MLCRSVTGTSISDHLVYYGVALMSGEPGTCRIVMDPPVMDYGTTDLRGNFILSRNPATPVIKLNTDSGTGGKNVKDMAGVWNLLQDS